MSSSRWHSISEQVSSSSSVTLFPSWSQPSGPRSRRTVAVTVPWEGLRKGRVCTVPLSVYIIPAVRCLSYVGASSLRVCSFGPVWCRCLSVVTWWFPFLFCAVRRSLQKCMRVTCVLGAWGLRSIGDCENTNNHYAKEISDWSQQGVPQKHAQIYRLFKKSTHRLPY